MARVALAYSGKLDTAICVHYLSHHKGMKVFTFSANLGQPEYLEPLAERAVELGATAAHLADLREKFVEDYIYPSIRANAVYEHGYYLFSALSRPLIVDDLVQIAREEDCDYIAHGSRGLGGENVRIENALRSLAPDLQILSPLQELGLRTPKDDIEFARAHAINYDEHRPERLNMEQNLWANNVRLHAIKDAWEPAPAKSYVLTCNPTDAPAKPVHLEVGFDRGIPVSVDGEGLPPVKLIEKLNKIGGRCAVGRFDIVENRLTGLKTREIYEAPAATILIAAHRALEMLTLEREVLHFKEPLSIRYADLINEGRWFLPFREGLDAFFARIQQHVTGSVRIMLFKGGLSVLGRKSPYSLFRGGDQS